MAEKDNTVPEPNKPARVLLDITVEGARYKSGDVVSMNDILFAEHVAALQVDPDEAAVAYALTQNGNVIIEHKPAVTVE